MIQIEQKVQPETPWLQPLIDCNDDTWFTYWMNFTAHYVDFHAALVMVDDDKNGQFKIVEFRPNTPVYLDLLQSAAQQAIEEKHPVISPTANGSFTAALPLLNGGQVVSVVALILPAGRTESGDESKLTYLEWCASWLELRYLRYDHQKQIIDNQRQNSVLDGFVAIFEQATFPVAALAFCNYISRQLDCDRVVLAYQSNQKLTVECQSDSHDTVKRVSTMGLMVSAMQETLAQQESIVWPPRDETPDQVNTAHNELAIHLNQTVILTVPIVEKEQCFGVLLMERSSDKPFDLNDQARAESLVNLVGLGLEQKRQVHKPLHKHVITHLHGQLSRFLRPGYIVRKLVLLSLVTLIILFSLLKSDYNLATDALVEGAEVRSVVVPFDGFLESAIVRAGDTIVKGKSIASLDTRELRLQRMKWLSDISRAKRQYDDALSRSDRAQVQIYFAQMEKAKAELALVDFQLAQANMVAPFDAVVVSGDQSQKIGSSVRQGDVLFELAPNDRYRLVLFVDELRINDIHVGQTGELVLSAMFEQLLEFKINKLIPVAEPRDGETVYRVEAEITVQQELLRPGLLGVAKVHVDRRLLIDIWTRGLRDWVQLQWWRFWG